jgi:SAM-dependent methyltransferase
MDSSSLARKCRRLASLFAKHRKCPLCGWVGYRFEPFGSRATHRQDALCSTCGSLERHRLAYLLLRDQITRGQRVLHVAPEQSITLWLISLSCEYLSIDLYGSAMRQMDLTDLELGDGSKTLIWCSHVLQYISNERKALSEMYRVLKPGGLLVLQVPIENGPTYDDPNARCDYSKSTQFLYEDRLRLYGLDLKDHIEQAGFECDLLTSSQFSLDERALYAVDARLYREVFVCRRPPTKQQHLN